MKRYAIIVAGGSGSRFGSAVPKQFLPLAGLPVLMHTISRFTDAGATVVLALPKSQIGYWKALCLQYRFLARVTIVEGGDTRFGSVKNAISAITPAADDLVAIHDGVRPLVSHQVIENAYAEAAIHGNAIPVVPVTDSIRQTGTDGESHAIDRSSLVAVQTPQVFNAKALQAAYAASYDPTFTDDASVIEHAGHSIHLVKGDTSNIKITHPDDIKIAEILLQNGASR